MITLRPASLADAAFLLRLRNDPLTIANSLSPEEVPAEWHAAWMTECLENPSRYLYVAERQALTALWAEAFGRDDGASYGDPIPLGTVRLDRVAEIHTAEVSLTMAPEHRGQGWAGPMLDAARVQATTLGLTRLVAVIKPANTASVRAFLSAGYHITAPADVLTLEREG